MDDIQLCKDIMSLKKELQNLVATPGNFLANGASAPEIVKLTAIKEPQTPYDDGMPHYKLPIAKQNLPHITERGWIKKDVEAKGQNRCDMKGQRFLWLFPVAPAWLSSRYIFRTVLSPFSPKAIRKAPSVDEALIISQIQPVTSL